VIEGMKVTGIMNAKLKFRLPGILSFDDCKTIPISQEENGGKVHSTDEWIDTVPSASPSEQAAGWLQQRIA
jgi:hypothetical protein